MACRQNGVSLAYGGSQAPPYRRRLGGHQLHGACPWPSCRTAELVGLLVNRCQHLLVNRLLQVMTKKPLTKRLDLSVRSTPALTALRAEKFNGKVFKALLALCSAQRAPGGALGRSEQSYVLVPAPWPINSFP